MIFSMLIVIAVLVTPLLTALPVYADWGADIRLTNALGNSKSPSVAVSGNIVHVVWFDSRDGNDEIYYSRSIDGGTTWGANVRLTTAAGNSFTPSIAVSGNNVHIAWHDSRSGFEEIYYKRSTDGGTTWGADTRLTFAGVGAALSSIAVSGNNVHVAWQDQRDGNWEIYYECSTDSGTTWGADTRLINAAGDSKDPSIAVFGNNVHVAWQDRRGGNFQIYYKRSTDGGTTWGADTPIVNSPKLSEFPSIAVSGNNVHVAWQDNRDEYYPKWEIYYKRSTDGGITWSTNTRLSCAPDLSEVPVIAVSVNSVHVAWMDLRDGNYEIYYKKFTPVPTVTSCSPTDFTFNSLIGTTPHGSSMSGITAAPPQSPVSLPIVSVKAAYLSAKKIAPGTPITVTADVVNTGTVNGSSSIKVYVNGELENSEGVTVNSGSSMPVTFTVSRNEPGTYSVYVGGIQAGSFTVDQFADSNMILYISGTLILLAFAIGVIYVTGKRQPWR